MLLGGTSVRFAVRFVNGKSEEVPLALYASPSVSSIWETGLLCALRSVGGERAIARWAARGLSLGGWRGGYRLAASMLRAQLSCFRALSKVDSVGCCCVRSLCRSFLEWLEHDESASFIPFAKHISDRGNPLDARFSLDG